MVPSNPLRDKDRAYINYDSCHAVVLKCLHPHYVCLGGRGTLGSSLDTAVDALASTAAVTEEPNISSLSFLP